MTALLSLGVGQTNTRDLGPLTSDVGEIKFSMQSASRNTKIHIHCVKNDLTDLARYNSSLEYTSTNLDNIW